jgi:hypothetical protein
MNNPNANIDPWVQYSDQAIKAYQGLSTSNSLRDYVPTNLPKSDPPATFIPGTSDLPLNHPDRQREINVSTVLVTNTGHQFKNPHGDSLAPASIPPAPLAIPSIADVIGKVNTFGDAAVDVVEHYEATKDDSSDHERLIQLGEELAPLAKRVAELQDEVDAIKAKPAPSDKLIFDVRNLTADYGHALSDAYQSVLEARSQAMFNVAYKRLSEATRSDLRLGMSEFDTLVARQRVRFSLRDGIKSPTAALEAHKAILADAETLAALLEVRLK